MTNILKEIAYSSLNSRQKENYNFQKLSAVLANYGFVVTFRLSDDWQGADFIAQHIDGDTFLKVQLKSRLTFAKKYFQKRIYVAFFELEKDVWYLYPHDKLMKNVLKIRDFTGTKSWKIDGVQSYSSIPAKIRPLLKPFTVTGDLRPGENPD